MNCQELNRINPLSGNYSRQNFSCIYRIVSILTGRCYVGSAKHFGTRRRNHVFQLQNNKHHSRILQNHFNKYGVEDIYFEVLEFIKWDEKVYSREQFYIDMHTPYFNVLTKVIGKTNKPVSEETREKMRVAQTGKKHSEETKEKRRASLKETFKLLSHNKIENRKKGGMSRAKMVMCIETGIQFSSIVEAEKLTGCDNISAICQGKRNNSLGLTFKYI